MSAGLLDRGRRVLRQRGVRAAARGVADEVQARVELRRLRRANAETFVVGGDEHTQLVHLHNRTWRNERTVEIPLATFFLSRHEGPLLELGNVLANYGRSGHVIIDKYEHAPGVVNVDVVDYWPEQRFQAIVSISTLEHVGWDELPRDPAKIPLAVEHLRHLLRPSGRMLVTCPLSYNPHLDALIRSGALRPANQTFLVGDQGRWREVDELTAFAQARLSRYGATAIWVAELTPDG